MEAIPACCSLSFLKGLSFISDSKNMHRKRLPGGIFIVHWSLLPASLNLGSSYCKLYHSYPNYHKGSLRCFPSYKGISYFDIYMVSIAISVFQYLCKTNASYKKSFEIFDNNNFSLNYFMNML